MTEPFPILFTIGKNTASKLSANKKTPYQQNNYRCLRLRLRCRSTYLYCIKNTRYFSSVFTKNTVQLLVYVVSLPSILVDVNYKILHFFYFYRIFTKDLTCTYFQKSTNRIIFFNTLAFFIFISMDPLQNPF